MNTVTVLAQKNLCGVGFPAPQRLIFSFLGFNISVYR